MFGCIVAGRLIQTNIEQVGESQYVFNLQNSESINHIVVFLLGTIPFEQGYAATVHFKWPTKDWICLGVLTNEKPSAIFKLKSLDHLSSENASAITSILGISIEPIHQVEAAYSALKANSSLALTTTAPNHPQNLENSALTMLQSLYDYSMSFATKFSANMSVLGSAPLSSNTSVIPVKAIEDWFKSYKNKIARGALK
ncbi:Protein OPI10-like protein [Smittium culicis]|uniref:Protein OPI10-like protein n=1 Tax=Smittium culicis TaxID=133412 RepID=A0A1R1X146_9FUNG|nr:Protein OPI10-like protein [Smittium culicis]